MWEEEEQYKILLTNNTKIVGFVRLTTPYDLVEFVVLDHIVNVNTMSFSFRLHMIHLIL
jgi:hypothetical protein